MSIAQLKHLLVIGLRAIGSIGRNGVRGAGVGSPLLAHGDEDRHAAGCGEADRVDERAGIEVRGGPAAPDPVDVSQGGGSRSRAQELIHHGKRVRESGVVPQTAKPSARSGFGVWPPNAPVTAVRAQRIRMTAVSGCWP